MNKSEKLDFLLMMKDIDTATSSELSVTVIYVSIILLYLLYIIVRFAIQRRDKVISSIVQNNYSTSNNIVLVTKKISNIADSFRFLSKNYIFVHPIFITNKLSKNKKDFIVNHEIFHGLSHDSISKAIILSGYIFLPILIINYISFPILVEFTRPIYPEGIFSKNTYYISFIFFFIASIYIFIKRKEFISIFFYYKEYLADYYAYKKTNIKYSYKEIKLNNAFHPPHKERLNFLEGRDFVLKADMYIYILTLLYISNTDYKIPALILASLLAFIYMIVLRHLYITFACFILCTAIIIIYKIGIASAFYKGVLNYDFSIFNFIDIFFIGTIFVFSIIPFYRRLK